MKYRAAAVIFIFLLSVQAEGEPLRVLLAGIHTVSLTEGEGTAVPLSFVSSSIIKLEGDTRFFRGIELELSAPQNFPAHSGSVAAALYGELSHVPAPGVADLEGRQLAFSPLPAKIQTVYQIPLRPGHGLRTTPYATLLTDVVEPSAFPLLFRLMPVIKGFTNELERMVFSLKVKPILSDEGALRINFRYPLNLTNRPFMVLIDDVLIENPGEERLIKEGLHHLVILSENYRNQSSSFIVERAKVLYLNIELQDPTPILIFEYPENARVFLDNVFLPNPGSPTPVEPGLHEVRFEVSDYTILRPVTVQKGKTYRIALSVDVNITETE
jgi:hypothetical protein